MDNVDLKYIKKHYGENFAKLCRELFPTILERPGLLTDILVKNVAPSTTLYDDVQERRYAFRSFIFSKSNIKVKKGFDSKKSPEQLFDEAGYILYPECETVKDVEKFKKYYKRDEEICTFWDIKDRLDKCRVWFAVKKNVDDIKREYFRVPEREDEYGTSVLSIQFTKEPESIVSIKNRYNHKVNNPDATFSNDLENITPGLNMAFFEYYDIKLAENNQHLEFLPNSYIADANGKYHKIIATKLDGCYCENNTILLNPDMRPLKLGSDKYLVFDGYVIDFQNKTIGAVNYKGGNIGFYEDPSKTPFVDKDSFIKSLGSQKDFEKMTVTFDEYKNRVVTIKVKNAKDIVLKFDEANLLCEYRNENATEIENNFLSFNKHLKTVYLPNVESIGDNFLSFNKTLHEAYLPKVKYFGQNALVNNNRLYEINLPNVEEIGDNFLERNNLITDLNLPKLRTVGSFFLAFNDTLFDLDAPNLEFVGSQFLFDNKELSELNLPNLQIATENFLSHNDKIKTLNLPNLEFVGKNFFGANNKITSVNLPNLKKIGPYFLSKNKILTNLSLPSVEYISKNFMPWNNSLKSLELPNCKMIDSNFLSSNNTLVDLNLPEILVVRNNFLENNAVIRTLYVPKLQSIDKGFLTNLKNLETLRIPRHITQNESSCYSEFRSFFNKNPNCVVKLSNVEKKKKSELDKFIGSEEEVF